ncbi:MAG: hypothetical protein IJY79_00045, partial [Clostridia bacterium]|nr:hypothetical protein [Clostridia bacterium]
IPGTMTAIDDPDLQTKWKSLSICLKITMTFRRSGTTGICPTKNNNKNQNNRKLILEFAVVFLFYTGLDSHKLK